MQNTKAHMMVYNSLANIHSTKKYERETFFAVFGVFLNVNVLGAANFFVFSVSLIYWLSEGIKLFAQYQETKKFFYCQLLTASCICVCADLHT